MPDGSPIDQWWKSHRPAQVSTNKKTAVHFIGRTHGKAYCGYRGGSMVNMRAMVTCSECVAAMRADHTDGGQR